jgi:hypothetical protein
MSTKIESRVSATGTSTTPVDRDHAASWSNHPRVHPPGDVSDVPAWIAESVTDFPSLLAAIAAQVWKQTGEPLYDLALAEATLAADQAGTVMTATEMEEQAFAELLDARAQAILLGWCLCETANQVEDVEAWCRAAMVKAGLQPLSQSEREGYEVQTVAAYEARNAAPMRTLDQILAHPELSHWTDGMIDAYRAHLKRYRPDITV